MAVLGRRGVVLGALGLAAVSACDVDDLRPPEDPTRPTPSTSASPTAEPDADVTLAEDAGHRIASAAVLVDRVRRDFPALRQRLKPLARMHRAHLGVVEAPDDRSVPAPAPASGPDDALARVRSSEQALQAALVTAAVEARSGALARLLASMSASVSQHLAALPAQATAQEDPS